MRAWQKREKNGTSPKRSVSTVSGHSAGARSGNAFGRKLNIVVSDAGGRPRQQSKTSSMSAIRNEGFPRDHESEAQEYESYAFHPYNILLTLLLFSLTALFLSLSAAFIYTRVQSDLPPIKLPIIFLFNTVVLLASSGTMMWAKRAYQEDDTNKYKLALGVTIGLSFLFMALQVVGWMHLFQDEIFISSDNSAGYLYVISGLHFAHVIGGIPFLGYFLWQAHKKMKEPVSVLVYFSDPEKRLKLRLLTIYWHFLDALWIYLVLFFFVNYLLR